MSNTHGMSFMSILLSTDIIWFCPETCLKCMCLVISTMLKRHPEDDHGIFFFFFLPNTDVSHSHCNAQSLSQRSETAE